MIFKLIFLVFMGGVFGTIMDFTAKQAIRGNARIQLRLMYGLVAVFSFAGFFACIITAYCITT